MITRDPVPRAGRYWLLNQSQRAGVSGTSLAATWASVRKMDFWNLWARENTPGPKVELLAAKTRIPAPYQGPSVPIGHAKADWMR